MLGKGCLRALCAKPQLLTCHMPLLEEVAVELASKHVQVQHVSDCAERGDSCATDFGPLVRCLVVHQLGTLCCLLLRGTVRRRRLPRVHTLL